MGIAQLFSQHAQDHQVLAGQAAAFHGQFVQKLTASAGAYASSEDAIASLMHGWNNLLRSFFTESENVTFAAFALPLQLWGKMLFASLPPDQAGPDVFVSALFTGLAAAVVLSFIEAFAESITGQVGPI